MEAITFNPAQVQVLNWVSRIRTTIGLEKLRKLDAIIEYIKEVVPSTKSLEQKRKLLRHILEEIKNENMIQVNGRTWFENEL